jgi:hypothetical protein
MTKTDHLAETLQNVLTSPNVCDANGEPANVVDTLGNLASAVWFAAEHRTDPRKRPNAMEHHAETIKAGLELVAMAIGDLASAIRESKE